MTVAVLAPDGTLSFAGRSHRAALGRAGVTGSKREGDEATPSGVLVLRQVLFRADRLARPPRTAVSRAPLAPSDAWCDDPLSPDYNRLIQLPHTARHEALWRSDALYDIIGVLGWNDSPALPQRGSAIFLHIATPDLAPTLGCVALPIGDLLALLGAGLTALDVRGAGVSQ